MEKGTRTVAWLVYGLRGQAQEETFEESFVYDFSTEDEARIIEVDNAGKTGTNEYAVVRITTNSIPDCYRELHGQITDGIFENYNVGDVVMIVEI